ncbi:alpha/beta hydrolase [Natronosporangium hydrolyticum]|uniref:Alpha/beta hydrolase n=1 Tax=Natronosporangium hydrolyticum TaxID=2811111 RepID=A0A895YH32_9ACTN|nr:alpha/beta hydrolase [Natronosporangium hydrolyticum]QSB13008.1 alpha/beta hydrolase [Natronosporangium hydrolyticum]
MPYVTVGRENTADIKLFYEDHGSGDPVVLIHGFPLNGASWEKQTRMLLDAGYRVITYDRRGFGQSSQPAIGYDYDTFTADFAALMEQLDLANATLIGHSMGTGEITRYLGRYGSDRVRRAVLLSPLPPYLLKTDDNPEGVDRSVFTEFQETIARDRPFYIKLFFDTFFNVDETLGKRLSDQAWLAHFNVGITASATGTYQCVDAWLTDFRDDVRAIDVPVLAIQGTVDRVLPIDSTGRRLPGMMPDVELIELEGAPHSLPWTHAEEVNRAIGEFLAR